MIGPLKDPLALEDGSCESSCSKLLDGSIESNVPCRVHDEPEKFVEVVRAESVFDVGTFKV